MFDFKRRVKTWATANTDITYLENKDKLLEDLTNIKNRLFELVCQIDDEASFRLQALNGTLSTPFIGSSAQSYAQEMEKHIELLQVMQQSFENFMAKRIDEMLAEATYRTKMVDSKMQEENLRIEYCRNRFREAVNVPLVHTGKDVIEIDEYAKEALALFRSSWDYVQVLHRSRVEDKPKKR